MTITFQPEDYSKYDCKILEQGVDVEKMEEHKLPTDSHLVEYKIGADTFIDIVRAHKMSDIFDAYSTRFPLSARSSRSVLDTERFDQIYMVL